MRDTSWSTTELAHALSISQSEVSKALDRLVYSGLIDSSKKLPARNALYDLIINSVKYIFPVKPGRLLKGIPTSHSAKPLSSMIVSDNKYIWPSANGTMKGESIDPLYKNVPDAALKDESLYELLALIDSIRVGKVREVEIAKVELKKRILG